MAHRTTIFSVARSFQRSLGVVTCAVRRAQRSAATKAVKAASKHVGTTPDPASAFGVAKPLRGRVKPLAPPPGTAAESGRWQVATAVGSGGARRYRLFIPGATVGPGTAPLLVMLHGCGQDAAGFARSTRMQAIAARAGFLVLYPEQERFANAQGCWNWFETRSGRAFAEATSIITTIDDVCARFGADPSKVAVAGMSAGASMAVLLASRHAERFCAVAMHSGIGPGAANSTATAFSAMQGRQTLGALVREPEAPALPPLLVIQGLADPVVSASNGRAVAELWAQASEARAGRPRTVQRGTRHAMTLTDFKHAGSRVVSLCEVDGLAHAWSGGAASEAHGDPQGPDASRLIAAFVAPEFDRPAAA